MSKKTRLILLRAVLGALILLNMVAIFRFSSQNGEQSAKTSEKVTYKVAETTDRHFNEKPQEEQKAIVKKMELPVRKLAHMSEFATLGAVVFLFLLTWKKKFWFKYP